MAFERGLRARRDENDDAERSRSSLISCGVWDKDSPGNWLSIKIAWREFNAQPKLLLIFLFLQRFAEKISKSWATLPENKRKEQASRRHATSRVQNTRNRSIDNLAVFPLQSVLVDIGHKQAR